MTHADIFEAMKQEHGALQRQEGSTSKNVKSGGGTLQNVRN